MRLVSGFVNDYTRCRQAEGAVPPPAFDPRDKRATAQSGKTPEAATCRVFSVDPAR